MWTPTSCLASLPLPQATRRSVCRQTLSRHLIGMAAAQKFSAPLFPGRGNGISWRGLRVGGEAPLITRNAPHFQAPASFSPSVFTPKFPGIALSTHGRAAASVHCSREDTTPALDPKPRTEHPRELIPGGPIFLQPGTCRRERRTSLGFYFGPRCLLSFCGFGMDIKTFSR